MSTEHSAPEGAEQDLATQPEEWVTVEARGLSALMGALERADRKGYMPDNIAEAWADFEHRPAARIEALEAENKRLLAGLVSPDMVLVPRKPTPFMVREGGPFATSLSCYCAMIDAWDEESAALHPPLAHGERK